MPATVPAASDIAYNGQYGFPFSWAFCSNSGGTLTKIFGSAQAQTEEATPAPTKLDTAKFTPISGANAGLEQIVAGPIRVQEFKLKVTWSAAEEAAAQAALATKTKGVLAVIYGDSSQQAFGSGAALGVNTLGTQSLALFTEIAPGGLTSTGLRTAELTFMTPMPPVTLGTTSTALFT